MRLSQRDIVCVSVMDWDHPFRSSRHHLMEALASRNRVLFVNNQVNPYFAVKHWKEPRARRMLRHWWDARQNPQRELPGLWSFTPPPSIPMGQIRDPHLFSAIYRLNQARLRQSVQRACKLLNFQRPLLWISFNTLSSESLIGALNEDLVIYHCTDAIEAMPAHSRFAPVVEKRLLAAADLVFCSSRALAQAKDAQNPACHYIPNGADVDLFEQTWKRVHQPFNALQHLPPGPVLGFAGHMEERFDFDLLAAVAQSRPRWNFALAGPLSPRCHGTAKILQGLPNVHFLGLLPREQLPAFFNQCHALLIPFVSTAQTRAIYPLKLNEYLATGKPVALTPFSDLREFDSWIHTGAGVSGFREACEHALNDHDPSRAQERISIANQNRWDNRVVQMEQIILSALARIP
jgi:teichuronic acid biosynthesis glycosyltransferase TuaH